MHNIFESGASKKQNSEKNWVENTDEIRETRNTKKLPIGYSSLVKRHSTLVVLPFV
jgi:hypothetical protein